MKFAFHIFSVLILALALWGCVNTGDKESITLTSSTELLSLSENIASSFQREKNITVSVKGTLGQEESLLKNKLTDLIVTNREIVDATLQSKKIGYEKTIIVVNKENPIEFINKQQLKEIFQGKIKNWSEINPSFDQSIQSLNRENASAIRQNFERYFLDGDYSNISLRSLTVNSNLEISSAISNIKGGIGYLSEGNLTQNLKSIKIIDTRTKQEIKSPKTDIFYVWSKEPKKKILEDLLDYLESPQITNILDKEGISY